MSSENVKVQDDELDLNGQSPQSSPKALEEQYNKYVSNSLINFDLFKKAKSKSAANINEPGVSKS